MKEFTFIATDSYVGNLTKDKIYRSKEGRITYDNGYVGNSYDNYQDFCFHNKIYSLITEEIKRKGNINNFE